MPSLEPFSFVQFYQKGNKQSNTYLNQILAIIKTCNTPPGAASPLKTTWAGKILGYEKKFLTMRSL